MNELISLLPAAGAALFFGGVYVYKMRKYKAALRCLGGEIDRILHGSGELVPGSYAEGEISILRDEIYKMTVRLREQSERLSEDKNALADALTDISHQIRTPLTTLNLMTARMMQEGENPEQRKQILREMNRMLERIDWLITALLKMSKLDAGAIRLEPTDIAMKEFLQKVMEPFEIQMDLRDQHCRIEGAEGKSFTADEAWTLEAVRNVVKNSLDYTPNGKELQISCLDNPLYAEITVCDVGPGIDPKDLPHLFERFYKGKNAGNSSFGIGLALAQSILSRQNGVIRAENRQEGGGRFRIRFYKQNI